MNWKDEDDSNTFGNEEKKIEFPLYCCALFFFLILLGVSSVLIGYALFA